MFPYQTYRGPGWVPAPIKVVEGFMAGIFFTTFHILFRASDQMVDGEDETPGGKTAGFQGANIYFVLTIFWEES